MRNLRDTAREVKLFCTEMLLLAALFYLLTSSGCSAFKHLLADDIPRASRAIGSCIEEAPRPAPTEHKPVSRSKPPQYEPQEAFLRAIYAVESSCGRDARIYRPGPAGELGPLQITPGVLEDLEGRYSDRDRLSLAKSREIALEYTDRWGATTVEERCRCFHRGPSQQRWYGPAGDRYWAKCQAALKDR